MSRTVRDEWLHVFSEFGDHAPDLRLGQLLANLAFLARSSGPSDVYDVEDEERVEAARSYLLDLERRVAAIADTPA